MKIKLKDGTVETAKTTGIARRMIQAGEAVEYTEPTTKSDKSDDDKSKHKPKASGGKKDSSSDVSGD